MSVVKNAKIQSNMLKIMQKYVFFNKMLQLLGDKYDLYLSSLKQKPKRSIRFNGLKTNRKDFEKMTDFNLTKNKVIDNCYYVDNEEKIGNTIIHHSGMFYVQEPSACIPVFSVRKKIEGKIVLDLCASPGGKTGQLAEYVGENGLVVSNEYVNKRVNILRGNVERMGYRNVAIISNDSYKIGKIFQNKFDCVLVDAPCSGEGMFRKDPNTITEWSEEGIISNSKRQIEILENICSVVKCGGYLVYSTCTFSVEENENVVKQFLESHREYVLVELEDEIKTVSDSGFELSKENNLHLNYCRRFYPFRDFGEGQFVAIMQNVSQNNEEYTKNIKYFNNLSVLEKKLVNEFLKNYCKKFDFELAKVGGYIFILPKTKIDLSGLNVVTNGVCLGCVEKNRFVPHHNFFTAYGRYFNNQLNLSLGNPLLEKFISGEQLFDESVKDGYVAVFCENSCLGFGKAKNGVINNLYPKGLRKIK